MRSLPQTNYTNDTEMNQTSRDVQSSISSTVHENGTMPLTPAQLLRAHSNDLTPYEQGEVLEFKSIYYWGKTAGKKQKVAASTRSPNNHGFDDDRGDYKIRKGDHLLYRFEIIDQLGAGSFGQVAQCQDHKTGDTVAIKLIRNKKRFHKQAKIEVDLLQTIQEHDEQQLSNVIPVLNSFVFRSHLCIVFPLASLNLYELIKKYKFRGFNLSLVRKFAVQMLSTLRFMKQLNIVHCDLKPENVLLRRPSRYSIWVIDFGSGCYEDKRVYTYIQSRFYRAPEVILGLAYGSPIDMWSFACILAELFTGYPIFPGQDEHEQLACIMEIFDVPPRHLRETCKRKNVFFDGQLQPILRPNPQGKQRLPNTKTLTTSLGCDDMQFLSFIEACLQWDPSKRMTPDEALQHPWIQGAPDHLLQAAEMVSPVSSTPLNESTTTQGERVSTTTKLDDTSRKTPHPPQPSRNHSQHSSHNRNRPGTREINSNSIHRNRKLVVAGESYHTSSSRGSHKEDVDDTKTDISTSSGMLNQTMFNSPVNVRHEAVNTLRQDEYTAGKSPRASLNVGLQVLGARAQRATSMRPTQIIAAAKQDVARYTHVSGTCDTYEPTTNKSFGLSGTSIHTSDPSKPSHNISHASMVAEHRRPIVPSLATQFHKLSVQNVNNPHHDTHQVPGEQQQQTNFSVAPGAPSLSARPTKLTNGASMHEPNSARSVGHTSVSLSPIQLRSPRERAENEGPTLFAHNQGLSHIRSTYRLKPQQSLSTSEDSTAGRSTTGRSAGRHPTLAAVGSAHKLITSPRVHPRTIQTQGQMNTISEMPKQTNGSHISSSYLAPLPPTNKSTFMPQSNVFASKTTGAGWAAPLRRPRMSHNNTNETNHKQQTKSLKSDDDTRKPEYTGRTLSNKMTPTSGPASPRSLLAPLRS